jgi:hypothetical protein
MASIGGFGSMVIGLMTDQKLALSALIPFS